MEKEVGRKRGEREEGTRFREDSFIEQRLLAKHCSWLFIYAMPRNL